MISKESNIGQNPTIQLLFLKNQIKDNKNWVFFYKVALKKLWQEAFCQFSPLLFLKMVFQRYICFISCWRWHLYTLPPPISFNGHLMRPLNSGETLKRIVKRHTQTKKSIQCFVKNIIYVWGGRWTQRTFKLSNFEPFKQLPVSVMRVRICDNTFFDQGDETIQHDNKKMFYHSNNNYF